MIVSSRWKHREETDGDSISQCLKLLPSSLLCFHLLLGGGGGGGLGECVIRIPLTPTKIFFSYLVQESSLAARLSPSDSLQQSLVMDGNRTAKRRTSKAVQKDKEMFVNFLAAPCKRKITTRTI